MADLKQQDAEYLKLLAIFHYVLAGMMALWGSFPIIHFLFGIAILFGDFIKAKPGEPSPALFGALFAMMAGAFITVGWTLALCTFIAGRCLAQRRNHMYCLIVAGVMAARMHSVWNDSGRVHDHRTDATVGQRGIRSLYVARR